MDLLDSVVSAKWFLAFFNKLNFFKLFSNSKTNSKFSKISNLFLKLETITKMGCTNSCQNTEIEHPQGKLETYTYIEPTPPPKKRQNHQKVITVSPEPIQKQNLNKPVNK